MRQRTGEDGVKVCLLHVTGILHTWMCNRNGSLQITYKYYVKSTFYHGPTPIREIAGGQPLLREGK